MSEVFVSTARKRVRIAFQQEGVTATALPVNVRLGQRRLRVVTIARQGLPGADGQDGGGTPRSETIVISNPNTDEHILTGGVPVTGSVKVFLNGIRETDYSVAGDTVGFDLDLGAGDKLTFDYLLGD